LTSEEIQTAKLKRQNQMQDLQHLLIVRHGDRWDYQHPEWNQKESSRVGDPPLSSLGHQQARDLGKFLDSFLTEKAGVTSADQITWLSSPFLRCLQTSEDALGEFHKMNNSESIKVFPEYSVFEWDGKGGKWHESLPPLEERIHYIPRLDTSYESMFVPEIPEPRAAFLDRCDRGIRCLNQRFPFRPKTAIVIVTHAAACIGLARAAANRTLQDITPAAPCSVFGLVRSENTNVWTIDPFDAPKGLNGYTDHLSKMGTATVPWNHFADKKVHEGYTGPPLSRFAPNSLKAEFANGKEHE